MNSHRLERLLAIAALALIAVAWFIGLSRSEADLEPYIQKAIPQAGFIEQIQGDMYSAWDTPNKDNLLGYISPGTANGYGGELRVVVTVSEEGTILGITVIDHKETFSFFRRVLRSRLLDNLMGKPYSDSFIPGQDVDTISCLLYTSPSPRDRQKSRMPSSA